MEPLVLALGITITSSQCTFHVMEAISASSLKRLQSKRQYYHRATLEREKERVKKKVYAIFYGRVINRARTCRGLIPDNRITSLS